MARYEPKILKRLPDPKTPPDQKKIGFINGIFLVLVALFFDGVQVFLNFIIIGVVLNYVVDGLAILTFYVWLKMLGVSMSNAKGMRIMLALIGAVFIELMPFINSLPAWTGWAVLTIIFDNVSRIPVVGAVASAVSSVKKPSFRKTVEAEA